MPVVSLSQLPKLIVPPAPGLPRLVYNHHVSRILTTAHVPDTHVLQRVDTHRLVHVVLGVVVVLLQLTGLQSLTSKQSKLIFSVTITSIQDSKTYIMPLSGAAEDQSPTVWIKLCLLCFC